MNEYKSEPWRNRRAARSKQREPLRPLCTSFFFVFAWRPTWLLTGVSGHQSEYKLLISAASAWRSAHTGLLVCCLESLIMAILKIRLLLARGAQQVTANRSAGGEEKKKKVENREKQHQKTNPSRRTRYKWCLWDGYVRQVRLDNQRGWCDEAPVSYL